MKKILVIGLVAVLVSAMFSLAASGWGKKFHQDGESGGRNVVSVRGYPGQDGSGTRSERYTQFGQGWGLDPALTVVEYYDPNGTGYTEYVMLLPPESLPPDVGSI